MDQEKYKELLKFFDGDVQLIDQLLASAQAAAYSRRDKEHIGAFRATLKTARPRAMTLDQLFFRAGGVSDRLQRTGGFGCL